MGPWIDWFVSRWHRIPRSGRVTIILSVVAFLLGMVLIIECAIFDTKWWFLLIGIMICIFNIWNIKTVWKRCL